MGQLPNNFLTTSEGAVASYAFSDIAAGTGMVLFNPCTAYQSSTVVRGLLNTAISGGNDSGLKVSGIGNNPAPSPVYFYSTPFQRSAIIGGDAFVIFTCSQQNNAGGSSTSTVTVNVRISGTEIATQADLGVAVSPGSNIFTHCVKITIPETHIAVGDTLELGFTASQTLDTSSNSTLLQHDSQNRDYSGGTGPNVTAATNQTRIDFYAPFKIDL